jgi:hypothetical protein
MPTRSYNQTIDELALELVWSLWAELGVSGWNRRHDGVAIDVEPLIIATSHLGTRDDRLLTESLDWCVLNARFVSAVRLRNLLPTFSNTARKGFDKFAATVRKHKPVSWPGETAVSALKWAPTGRSAVPDLNRPALVQLKLRALFGVSARAEILLRMLPEPTRPFGISELSMYTAFGKDNLSDALDLLALGGVVVRNVMTTAGNVQVFRLAVVEGLRSLLVDVPTPSNFPFWAARFRVITHLIDFAASAPTDRTARAATIQRLLGDLQMDLRWVASYPRLYRGVDEVNEGFDDWSVAMLSRWAAINGSTST